MSRKLGQNGTFRNICQEMSNVAVLSQFCLSFEKKHLETFRDICQEMSRKLGQNWTFRDICQEMSNVAVLSQFKKKTFRDI